MLNRIGLVCLLLSASSAFAAPAFSIIDLGSFNGFGQVDAQGLNNAGVAVGADFFAPNSTAFTWDGSLHALQPYGSDNSASANAINSDGRVVGDTISSFQPRAVIWNGTTPTLLPVPGTRSEGLDINDSGMIVGTFQVSFRDHAFALAPGAGTSIDLGNFGGRNAKAYSVNNVGAVVGSAEDAGLNDRAFIWRDSNGNGQSDPGEMKQLSDLGRSSAAYGINNAGVAAGFVSRPDFTTEAVLWQSDGTMLPLPQPAAGDVVEAFAVNSSLEAVGHADSDAEYWANGQAYNLIDLIPPDSGWTRLTWANDINDAGEIVGWGQREQGGNGEAFLLIPNALPEGGTLSFVYCATVFSMLSFQKIKRAAF
jgi:probable HAF family extracellular repeat protein